MFAKMFKILTLSPTGDLNSAKNGRISSLFHYIFYRLQHALSSSVNVKFSQFRFSLIETDVHKM